MDLLAQSAARYELADARRFTRPWERAASLRLRDGDQTVLREYHQQGRLLDPGTVDQAEASAAQAWLGDTLAGRRSLLLVDTNDQAARLSAQLRADLVRTVDPMTGFLAMRRWVFDSPRRSRVHSSRPVVPRPAEHTDLLRESVRDGYVQSTCRSRREGQRYGFGSA